MKNANQYGRSMIEMLGVLAIVGVLSVGGIAGYSKAMNKFKTNKVIEQITMISTNIRTLYSGQRSYKGLSNAMAIATGCIPAEMYEIEGDTIDSDHQIVNAFSGDVSIIPAWHKTTMTENNLNSFMIGLDGIPKTSCITLATTDWGGDVGSGFAAIYVGATEEDIKQTISSFNSEYASEITTSVNLAAPGDPDFPTPMTVLNAQQACSSDTDNSIIIAYI